MCGVSGFVDFSGKLSEQDIIDSLTLLKHRGPDDTGFYFRRINDASIAMGNSRLSIIDLSAKGHQPFQSDCGNYVLVFNGTIYNYRELRQELSHLGVKFQSDSDTEVLLQSYITWPDTYLQKLNGVFAFSIYDKIKNSIFLVRDKIGVKPLFYYFQKNTLLFGSELRVFLKQPIIPKKIDMAALSLYLEYGYFPSRYSILENVFKVSPGEVVNLNISSGHLEKSRYWYLNPPKISNAESIGSIIENTHEKLVRSVTSRLVSDAPTGFLLSGGYDSSTVAAIAQKHHAKKIQTFTIGFNEAEYNEAVEAQKIADHIGSEHRTLYFNDSSIFELITSLGQTFDEPMGDSGAIPLLLAGQLAQKHVKVLHSAEGGDELFGGYNSYFHSLKYSPIAGIVPFPQRLKKRRLINIFSKSNPLSFYKALRGYFTPEEATLFTGTASALKNDYRPEDKLNTLLNFDLLNYLPDDLLMKADRCLMHFGLENRAPLLDIGLVEYVTALPGDKKCPQRKAKYLLKEIAHQYIPKPLLDRPKKGFSMPVGKWLSTNLREFTEQKIRTLSEKGLLNQELTLNTLSRFRQNPQSYFSGQIWILLALELWLEEWID